MDLPKNQSYHTLSSDELFKQLNSRKEGLTSQEVANIRQKVGDNAIPKPKVNFYQKYIRPVFTLMIIILFLAAIIQLILGSYFSAISIFVILTANISIAMFQQRSAEKALEALDKISAFKATVLRDGQPQKVESTELVPGDVLSLKQGDRISADARLFEANDLTIDESVLTGESVPVEKKTEALRESILPIQQQFNIIFSSTYVATGNGKACVIGTGVNTQIGRISKGIAQMEYKEIPLQRQMSRLAKGLGLLVVCIAAFLFIVQILANVINGVENTTQIIIAEFGWVTSLAVAAIPFNFPLITTIILLTGVLHLARKQAIIRKLNAVETLGRISVICSDKTGTLTQNEMTVKNVLYCNTIYDVTGHGYNPKGEVTLEGKPVNIASDPNFTTLVQIGLIDNNSTITEETVALRKGSQTVYKLMGNPTEGALLSLGMKVGVDPKKELEKVKVLKEISFSSERKRMSKIVDFNGKRFCFTKGAPERILDLSGSIVQTGGIVPITDAIKSEINQAIEKFNNQGLRTLGLSLREISTTDNNFDPNSIEKDLIFFGVVAIYDPPREGVKQAVKVCHEAGIKVAMITGDHPVTAKSIAENLGIWRPGNKIVEGKEIKNLSSSEILETTVFARVAPEDKQFIVKALQDRKQVVAMTGDGVNDALALENADVGIAMGIAGTDVAKNASDLILTDDSFATIETAVYHGRGLFNNIRANIVFFLVANLLELVCLVVIKLAFFEQMFTSYQLTIFYITIHFFPPFGLMFDKYDPNLMRQPPKKADEPLLSKNYLMIIGIQVITISATLIVLFSIYATTTVNLNADNYTEFTVNFWLWHETGFLVDSVQPVMLVADMTVEQLSVLKARTICLTTLFLSEAWVAFEARSEHRSMFQGRFNLALYIMVGITVGLLLFINNFDLAHVYLGLVKLSAGDWAVAILASLTPIIVMELFKKVH